MTEKIFPQLCGGASSWISSKHDFFYKICLHCEELTFDC